MIFTFQIPEEFRTIASWDRPVGMISESMRLRSAHFVPGARIYQQKHGQVELTLSNQDFVIANLLLGKEQMDDFFAFPFNKQDWRAFQGILKLSKRSLGSVGFALPVSVVQVELE